MRDNVPCSKDTDKHRTLPEKIAILRHLTGTSHNLLGDTPEGSVSGSCAPDEPAPDDARASSSAPDWEFWWQLFGFRLSVLELMILVLVLGAGLGLLAARLRRETFLQWAALTAAKTGVQLGYTKDHEVEEAYWRQVGVPSSSGQLSQIQISDEDIAFLRAYDRLEALDMEGAVMTDAGLAAIGALPRLRRVSCFKPRITDRGLGYLRESTHLQSLRLLRAHELTDAGLVHLANLTNIEELNLASARIVGPGLAHLAGMRRLRSLVIPGAPLTDAGLAHLGRLSSLRELYIGGGVYTDAGLAHLSGLTALTKLGLGSSGLSEAGLSHITELPHLEVLQLDGPQVTDAWLDRLAGIRTLRQLYLGGATVSDAAIERLKRARPQLQIAPGQRRKRRSGLGVGASIESSR